MDWEHNHLPWKSGSPWSSGPEDGPWPAVSRARGGPGDARPPMTDRKGEEDPASPIGIEPVDIVLIDVMCGVAADHSWCTVCGRALSQGLRIELDDSAGADRKWLASVSCRCRGWGRHPNEARVWRGSDGLHLEPFAVRA